MERCQNHGTALRHGWRFKHIVTLRRSSWSSHDQISSLRNGALVYVCVFLYMYNILIMDEPSLRARMQSVRIFTRVNHGHAYLSLKSQTEVNLLMDLYSFSMDWTAIYRYYIVPGVLEYSDGAMQRCHILAVHPHLSGNKMRLEAHIITPTWCLGLSWATCSWTRSAPKQQGLEHETTNLYCTSQYKISFCI